MNLFSIHNIKGILILFCFIQAYQGSPLDRATQNDTAEVVPPTNPDSISQSNSTTNLNQTIVSSSSIIPATTTSSTSRPTPFTTVPVTSSTSSVSTSSTSAAISRPSVHPLPQIPPPSIPPKADKDDKKPTIPLAPDNQSAVEPSRPGRPLPLSPDLAPHTPSMPNTQDPKLTTTTTINNSQLNNTAQSPDEHAKNVTPATDASAIQPKRGTLLNSQRAQAIVSQSPSNALSSSDGSQAAPSSPSGSNAGNGADMEIRPQAPGTDHRYPAVVFGGTSSETSKGANTSTSGSNMTLIASIGGVLCVTLAVIAGFVAVRKNPKLLDTFRSSKSSQKTDTLDNKNANASDESGRLPSIIKDRLETLKEKTSPEDFDLETVSTYSLGGIYSTLGRIRYSDDATLPPPLTKLQNENDDTSLLFGSPKSDCPASSSCGLSESLPIESVPQHYLNLIMPRLDMPLDLEVSSSHGELVNGSPTPTTLTGMSTSPEQSLTKMEKGFHETMGSRNKKRAFPASSLSSRHTLSSRFSLYTNYFAQDAESHLSPTSENSDESLSRYL